MKFEFSQISKFNATLLSLMVIGGFLVYMLYPTQARITSKWNAKIISLQVQIDAKREQRVKAKEDYLELDSTLSGTIVDLKSQMERYTACLNNLSLNCESATMIPQVSAAESTT